MSTGLDLRSPDLRDKNRVVFQLHIFDLRKLTIIGDTLNNSRDFIIQLWGTWPYQRPFCNLSMPYTSFGF